MDSNKSPRDYTVLGLLHCAYQILIGRGYKPVPHVGYTSELNRHKVVMDVGLPLKRSARTFMMLPLSRCASKDPC